MSNAAVVSLVVGLGSCVYSYVGYPALLKLLALGRARRRAAPPFEEWPSISITIPVHNEAAVIAGTLERLLELAYPVERRQILVVSDASSDGTDDIVARFAPRGVELLRLPERRGKTAAENAARGQLRGDIIVNTDASVRIGRGALKPLVAEFADPTVGVASGRDVSVARVDAEANAGESAYIGYEMWVRDLETRVGGIVGASGCLYAIRAALHREAVPEDLSRDFRAALLARRRGYRAVSVPEALCFVPRSASLRQEYRRKVRTMARGLRTLWAQRALLNPLRYGLFAWMLGSHKLCRWLVPWAALLALGAVGVLAPDAAWARAVLGAGVGVVALGAVGWWWPVRGGRNVPRIVALPAYAVSGNVAALHAWLLALSGVGTAVWEPTRRGTTAETA
ncbi:MAG: glycosyltransferase family 2 protein [Gemmatimonadetes bacterium]|nr:MAG: glycosyltransferase family 2 protein [Gemmatimonadota bacterium]